MIQINGSHSPASGLHTSYTRLTHVLHRSHGQAAGVNVLKAGLWLGKPLWARPQSAARPLWAVRPLWAMRPLWAARPLWAVRPPPQALQRVRRAKAALEIHHERHSLRQAPTEASTEPTRAVSFDLDCRGWCCCHCRGRGRCRCRCLYELLTSHS